MRVEKIYDTQAWDDLSLSRSNAPYGEKLHWTRASDILLYFGAYILSHFISFKEALYWFGAFINPLFHLIILFLIIFICKNLLKLSEAWILSILFPFQLITTRYFCVGIYDHHGFILLLFTIYLILLLSTIKYSDKKIFSVLCGFMAAICIWVSVESIFFIILSISFIGFAWIIYDSNYTINNLLMALCLFLTSAITLLIEKPIEEIFLIHYDQISIVHTLLWGLVLTFWLFVTILERNNMSKTIVKRIVISCSGIFFCITSMAIFFPNFLYGPEVNIDPLVKKIYMDNIREFSHLFANPDKLLNYITIIWFLGIISLLLCIYIIYHKHGYEKFLWSFVGFLLISFGSISVYQVRWMGYFQLLSIIPITFLFSKLFELGNVNLRPYIRPFIIVPTILWFIMGPILISQNKKETHLLAQSDFLNNLCIFLNNKQTFDREKVRILTSIYIGPLILYKTKHEVIGTPNHRNEKGIIDTFKIMNSEDENEAKSIINQRDIDIILIGRPEKGLSDYLIPDAKKEGKFYHRLWYGPIPEWTERVAVTEKLNNKIKIFRIKKKFNNTKKKSESKNMYILDM
jgi:hypothetical protein